MVVFTCSYCGESLKKNQVEKHYNFTPCSRKSPALSCVDCFKDFMNQDYVVHTSCVTEEERYSAKGFVSKPPSDKGKKKQEKWINSISNILISGMKLDNNVRVLIQSMVQDGNVPQKRSKFMNYCNSKFKSKFGIHDFEQVWQMFEKIHEEDKISRDVNVENKDDQEKKRKRVNSSNENPNIESSNSTIKSTVLHKKHKKNRHNSVNEEPLEKEKDKPKKSKKDKYMTENCDHSTRDNDHSDTECDNDIVIVGSNDIENMGDTTKELNDQSAEDVKITKLSKKEKKQKRKQEKYEKQLIEIQNEPSEKLSIDENENKVKEPMKIRKKKKQSQLTDGGNPSETKELNGNIKHKKKKHQESVPEVKESEVNNQNHIEVENTKPTKFNWEEIIIKVLETKGELPLKRLEKKVVNEYLNSSEHVKSVEDVIAKFNKKVMKIPRVKVKKEVAKLVS